MSLRFRCAIAAGWLISLVLTATWVSAQHRQWTPLTEPVIVSGDDVGFRVEWIKDRIPTGEIVIRLNGQWVEAHIGDPPAAQLVPPPPAPPGPPR
jgi:hypothetical protein